MSKDEWESLCDGCGKCCLHKLRDNDTDEVYFTNVACRLLDLETCQCSDYAGRFRKIPDCVSLSPALLDDIDWLPPSCSYRLVKEGYDLPDWHPLRSGSAKTVHKAGVSARGRIISEREAGMLEDHLADWPGAPPTKRQLRRTRQ